MTRTFVASSLLALLALPLLAGAAAPAPVAQWSFEEGTGRRVFEVVSGLATTLEGTLDGWTSGKVGTALGFSGATGEGLPVDAFPKLAQGSWSAWVRADQLRDGNVLFSVSSPQDNAISYVIHLDRDGRPTIRIRPSSSDPESIVQGMTFVPTREWTHLVITSNGSQFRMYRNGEEVQLAGSNTGRWFGSFANAVLTGAIGRGTGNFPGSLAGAIDEVEIYDTVFNDSEFTEIYTKENALRPTIPVAVRPSVVITASATSLAARDLLSLSWTSTNADRCEASGHWTGTAPISGTRTAIRFWGYPSIYTMTCTGKYGSATASVSVNVK